VIGSTGRSTGTHVHFEVERDGKKVSPMRYLDTP
jgi:murein DD-endopeptidase MepM/ murein hydrolase activator NlpD